MRKLFHTFLVMILVIVLVGGAVLWWLSGPRPELPEHAVYLNGRVFTMDSDNTVAEALSVRGERIEAVGSDLEIRTLIESNTRVIELDGATLLPGFIDAHGHFPGSGLIVLGADLNSPPIGHIRDIAALQAALRDHEEVSDADWLFGFGYDDTLLAEGRHPTRAELDEVAGDRPAVILHISGHMAVANSAALAAADINADTPDPVGGVIERDPDTGKPTGLLQEHAADPVLALAMDFGFREFMRMTDHAVRDYLAQGVTTAQSGGVDRRMLSGMSLMSRLHRIPLRLELWPLADSLGEELLLGEINLKSHRSPRFGIGAVKLMADGSIQGYTGYLREPYHSPYLGDVDYQGYPRVSVEALREQVLRFHRAGYQLAIHGNGDAAIDMILEAWQYAQRAYPRENARPIVVHAQMAREDQLDAMAELGITPSFFSAHTYYWGDRHRDIFIGPERAARISPTRSAVARGLPFTVHLDTPVVPMNPRLLLWSTVNRETASGKVLGPEQRIDVMQALRAMTIDAAWQIFREHDIGSLEPGKYADLVVLDTDPRVVADIRNIEVLRTVIGGRTYYAK